MTYIKVVGLDRFRKQLREAQAAEPKELARAMKEISQLVVSKARPRLRSQIKHPARSTGRLEASVKAASTVRTAAVRVGTPVRVPYAGWWIFGGPKYKSNRPPNRRYIKEGRVIYPVLAENTQEIYLLTEQVIARLARRL